MIIRTFDRRIILAGLTVVVLILAAIISLVSRSGTMQQSQTTQSGTPTPSPITLATPARSVVVATYQSSMKRLPSDSQTRMNTFIKQLPVSTADFDIAHDSELNTVLISFKSASATNTIKTYLQSQNVLDIYLQGSKVFLTSTKSISDLEKVLKNTGTYELEDSSDVRQAP